MRIQSKKILKSRKPVVTNGGKSFASWTPGLLVNESLTPFFLCDASNRIKMNYWGEGSGVGWGWHKYPKGVSPVNVVNWDSVKDRLQFAQKLHFGK